MWCAPIECDMLVKSSGSFSFQTCRQCQSQCERFSNSVNLLPGLAPLRETEPSLEMHLASHCCRESPSRQRRRPRCVPLKYLIALATCIRRAHAFDSTKERSITPIWPDPRITQECAAVFTAAAIKLDKHKQKWTKKRRKERPEPKLPTCLPSLPERQGTYSACEKHKVRKT